MPGGILALITPPPMGIFPGMPAPVGMHARLAGHHARTARRYAGAGWNTRSKWHAWRRQHWATRHRSRRHHAATGRHDPGMPAARIVHLHGAQGHALIHHLPSHVGVAGRRGVIRRCHGDVFAVGALDPGHASVGRSFCPNEVPSGPPSGFGTTLKGHASAQGGNHQHGSGISPHGTISSCDRRLFNALVVCRYTRPT